MVGCWQFSGLWGHPGARLGSKALPRSIAFTSTKNQPRLLSKSSSYEAFWFLNSDAPIMIMIFEWSMRRLVHSITIDPIGPQAIPLDPLFVVRLRCYFTNTNRSWLLQRRHGGVSIVHPGVCECEPDSDRFQITHETCSKTPS